MIAVLSDSGVRRRATHRLFFGKNNNLLSAALENRFRKIKLVLLNTNNKRADLHLVKPHMLLSPASAAHISDLSKDPVRRRLIHTDTHVN